MGMKDEKVHQLARVVADTVAKHPDVEVVGDRQSLEHQIREAILDNLAMEQEIDDEVTKLLTAAMRGQSRDSVNYAELFRKAKKELARKRGFVL